MQVATVEFARNVVSLNKANSTEFDPLTPHKIFFMWRELKGVKDLGGTMRLGQFLCRLKNGSFAHKAYGKTRIYERHRHRYEFNPEYEGILSKAGLFISGKNPEHDLVEIIEIKDHPWFLGCQFHPEFKSKPLKPHPLFKAFIGASYAYRRQRNRHQ
jgi:CTP synthase